MSYSTQNNRRVAASGNPVSLFPFLAVLLCTMGALISILLIMARQAQLNTEELIQEMMAESGETPFVDEGSGAKDQFPDSEFLECLEKNLANQAKTQEEAVSSKNSLKNATEDSEFAEIATEELEKRLEEIEAIAVQSEWHIQTFRAARGELEKNTQAARIALSTTQENRDRLRKQMETLRTALIQLQNPEAEQDPEKLKEEIATKQTVLEKLQIEFEKAENTAREEDGSYAILPHVGPNGTRRYPIYLECRDNGVWLMPENLQLNAMDFEGTLTMENPLEMALIAKRQYLLRNGIFRETPDNEQEPYPLIIVRPNGIIYLYMAKASLQSWKSEFGYELVEDETAIAYPPNDKNLEQEMTRAIEEARRRQQEIAAMAPTLSRNGGGSGNLAYRPTSRGGVAMNIDPDSRLARTLARSARPSSATMGGMAAVAQNSNAPQTANGADSEPPTQNRTAQTSGAYGSNGRQALQQAQTAQNGAGGDGNGNFDSSSLPSTSQTVVAIDDFSKWKTIQPGQTSDGNGAGVGTETGNYPAETPTANGPQTATGNVAGAGSASRNGTVHGNSGGLANGSAIGSANGSVNGVGMNVADANNPNQNSSNGETRIAESKGENWALANYHQNVSTLTRPVPMECRADRFVLSAIPGVPEEEIPITTPFQTGVRLANAITAQTKLWGEAGPGMIWKPILRIRVAPDAREQFERLKILLDGSGLIIEEVAP